MTPPRTASLIATIGVVIGLADLPYGYYTLLRFFLCGASLFLAFGSDLVLKDWHRWTLVGFVILYNPLVPIYLGEKTLWTLVNIVTVLLFWAISPSESGPLRRSSFETIGNIRGVSRLTE